MGLFSKLKTTAQNKVNDLQAGNSAPTPQQQQPLASSSSSNPSSPFIVARNGSLFLGNTPYRFAGLNAPELLDGDVNGPFEYANTFQSLSAPGAFSRAVTRTYTLRIKSKNVGRGHINGWNSGWGDWEWDEERLKEIDRVIAEAARYGVRLIIPIISNFDSEDTNWVGGWMDLIRLKKGFGSNEEATRSGIDWWTDNEMLEAFKLIIDKLVNRVNHLTGVRYADDATILAWETGNEMCVNGMRPAPASWTLTVAAHLKSRAPNHLVMDGSFARTEHIGSCWPVEVLQSPLVDIISYHYYGSGDIKRVKKDCELAKKYGKVFIAGEFGFFSHANEYASFLSALDSAGGAGALVWSLRPASARGGYKTHGEGDGQWSYHLPGWEQPLHGEFDPRSSSIVAAIRSASFKMNREKTGQELGRRQVWDCTKEGELAVDVSMELGVAPREVLGLRLRGIGVEGAFGPESEELAL
ncbi:glycoside hydrolase superfamily [Leucosporidium creatinivorum]|uniref:mannan endo-1,4-beta-mannosidase n=1 Tax=Leucosporidium creatinivorum TaxID=106004 RepID=A0A1Y2ELX3_9BASI|nr:glycoside hydrolase superfamily [Leucosporidium creatinivorum]